MTEVPPCKLLMQHDLRTRFSLLHPDCEKSVMDKPSTQKYTNDCGSKVWKWTVGDHVMVRDFRQGPDWIPGTITEVWTSSNFWAFSDHQVCKLHSLASLCIRLCIKINSVIICLSQKFWPWKFYLPTKFSLEIWSTSWRISKNLAEVGTAHY